MGIDYLKRDAKTPESNRTAQAVANATLADIQPDRERSLCAYAEKFDKRSGDLGMSEAQIVYALENIPLYIKTSIKSGVRQIYVFALAQCDYLLNSVMELHRGIIAIQRFCSVNVMRRYSFSVFYAPVTSVCVGAAATCAAGVKKLFASSSNFYMKKYFYSEKSDLGPLILK